MSKEEAAIENLLSCSENAREEEDEFDRVVSTSSWLEAATGWKKTEPNVIYLTLERKKKQKEKHSRTSPTLSSDTESHYQKVKKLAGMIANSNAQNQSLEANGGWPTNKYKTKSNLVKFQNVDVLSYDVPCWRYIIDPRTCNYVERKPLQILRNFCERKNRTAILENGGALGFQEVNGETVFVDPALSFDRHLLETLDHREEFRLKGDVCNSLDVPLYTTYRTEHNRIRVIHSGFDCGSGRRVELLNDETCRHSAANEPNTSELKPLQKITPTQRRAAEDSLLASRILVARAREMKSDSSTQVYSSRKSKGGKNKSTYSSSNSRVDWIPITKSTIHYQSQHMTGNTNHGRFPDRACVGKAKYGKAFSLCHMQGTKGNKLTLSEAANLMPGVGMPTALGKLTKELEEKDNGGFGIGISLSQHLLPSVSGTKFVMLPDTADT